MTVCYAKLESMRILLLLSLLFGTHLARAGFTYSETKHYANPSIATTMILSQKFSRLGYTPLAQTDSGRIPLINMDQIFEKEKQVIYFKQGLKPSDGKIIGSLIPLAKGLVFHGLTENKIHYALFFDGFKTSEAESVLKNSGLLQSKKFTVEFSLFPQACAADENCESSSPTFAHLQQVARFVDPAMISKLATSCAISAVKGVADGAIGMVEGAWSFTKTLFTDPEKLWLETKKMFGEIKDLVMNIGPRISQFIQSMKELDPEIATEIVCSTVSSIAIQALLGGGLAKGALLIGQKILSLEKIRKSLSLLSRLKRSGNPQATSLASKAVACIR